MAQVFATTAHAIAIEHSSHAAYAHARALGVLAMRWGIALVRK
jgi:hypothetical protein